MNRQIKFRCWISEQKKMIDFETFCQARLRQDWLKKDGENAPCESLVVTALYCTTIGDSVANKYIPLQFTGLTDKNGIEIYEGDFIRKESVHSDNVQIYQIVWFNGTMDFNGSEYAQLHSGFAAKLISDKSSEKDGEWTFHKIEDNDIRGIGQEFEFENYGTNGEPETKYCEVIGNIFENPELIK